MLSVLNRWLNFQEDLAQKTSQQAVPNIGHIYGKVADSLGKPMAEVTILLLQNKFDTLTKKRKVVTI